MAPKTLRFGTGADASLERLTDALHTAWRHSNTNPTRQRGVCGYPPRCRVGLVYGACAKAALDFPTSFFARTIQ
jgi:hypothetical protein